VPNRRFSGGCFQQNPSPVNIARPAARSRWSGCAASALPAAPGKTRQWACAVQRQSLRMKFSASTTAAATAASAIASAGLSSSASAALPTAVAPTAWAEPLRRWATAARAAPSEAREVLHARARLPARTSAALPARGPCRPWSGGQGVPDRSAVPPEWDMPPALSGASNAMLSAAICQYPYRRDVRLFRCGARRCRCGHGRLPSLPHRDMGRSFCAAGAPIRLKDGAKWA
jgi:hypothetical protein